MEGKPIGQLGLRELRELARLRMPREAWEHFMGAAGAEGVTRVIEVLTEEIKRVLFMTGGSSISELTTSILIHENERWWRQP